MDFTATDWFSNNELFESFQNDQVRLMQKQLAILRI
jgi:hypothetical protein